MVSGGGHRGVGDDQRRGTPPWQSWAPRPAPPPFAQRGDVRHTGRGERGSHEHVDARDEGTPLTRRPLTNNC